MIRQHDGELARIPLDDISVLLLSNRSCSLSNGLLVELAVRNIATVMCDNRFSPVGWVWPLSGHHHQAKRMLAQTSAPVPLSKRIWQQLIQSKIRHQAEVLNTFGVDATQVESLAKLVKSGDPNNVEAQAARLYWPLLMGIKFRRDRFGDWPNAALNYGYTILRSCAARELVAAGLHPTIGIHHHNRSDHLALADDLMEPFRPLVDLITRTQMDNGVDSLSAITKQRIAAVLETRMNTEDGTTPVHSAIRRAAQSLAISFEEKQRQLILPRQISPVSWETYQDDSEPTNAFQLPSNVDDGSF